MFIKRKRTVRKPRFLFNKHFIDIWGRVLRKKKLHNLTTKRFLTFFARYILIQQSHWRRRSHRSYRYRRPAPRRKILRAVVPPEPVFLLKRLVREQLLRYLHHKNLGLSSLIIKLWQKKRKRFLLFPRIKSKKRYWRRPRFPKKYIYLRKRRDYLVTPLMDLVLQQYHYGFSSLNSFANFVKRNASKGANWKLNSFGIEGMLANQVCRAGLVDDIRKGYVLVRSGAISVNGTVSTNPRLVIVVGDQFRVVHPFNFLIFKLLWTRLKARRWRGFNVAAYLEFNLRLMVFRVFRKPSKVELSVLSYYPYRKQRVDYGALKYFTHFIN